jgi:hypothetical protein
MPTSLKKGCLRATLATCVAVSTWASLASIAVALVTNPSPVVTAPEPQGNTICFKSAQYYLSHLKNSPNQPALIGRENRGQPVNTTNLSEIKLALQGGASPIAQLNKEFVAAQLNGIGGTNPAKVSLADFNLSDQSLAKLRDAYGLSFIPASLSTDRVLSPDSTLNDLFQEATAAIRQNRTTDMVQIATILHLLNGDNPYGGCGGYSAISGSNCTIGDGGRIITTGQPMGVKIISANALYNSTLYYTLPTSISFNYGKDRDRIGTINDAPKNLFLSYGPNLEVVFELDVKETGNRWYSGSWGEGDNTNKNTDRETHALVTCDSHGVATIRFEDLYGLGDRDFDDMVVQVSVDSGGGGPVGPGPGGGVLPARSLDVSLSYDWIGSMPTEQMVKFSGTLVQATGPAEDGNEKFDVIVKQTPKPSFSTSLQTFYTKISNLKQGLWTVTGWDPGLTLPISCKVNVIGGGGVLKMSASGMPGQIQCSGS